MSKLRNQPSEAVHLRTRLRELTEALVGRRIERVELEVTKEEYHGSFTENPILVLDNGVRVYFTVSESDSGDYYGVEIILNDVPTD